MKLMSRQPADLQQRIREIQTKMERTREMAADARDAADSALESNAEVEQVSCPKMRVSAVDNQPGCSFSNLLYGRLQEMKNLTKLFEDLKQKNASQTIQDEVGKRLKEVVDEVERMKRGMEDKLRQIQGTPPSTRACSQTNVHVQRRVVLNSVFPELEDKIHQLIRRKEEKAAEVSMLVDIVDSLRRNISKRADEYLGCTT